MSESWPPVPDPFGSLEPPRRNPPTAVGVATPPPPDHRPSYVDRRAMRRRRLASAFIGSVLTASASALAMAGSAWMLVASAGLGGAGGLFLYRSIKPRPLWKPAGMFSFAAIGRRFSRSRRRAA